MTDPAKIAVIYYSQTGNVHALAAAIREGAEKAGAEVRLRRVRELAPEAAIEANPGWKAHLEATGDVEEAAMDDLDWADGVVFGTPTRYGMPASQLKQFIDTTGPLWQQGKLSNKVYSAFVSAGTTHGGLESTVLALSNVFTHWGGIIVPPGYTDPIQFQTGTPYGTAHLASGGLPAGAVLEAARYQGGRVAKYAAAVRAAG
jgi:NAD(P)H dehydrogenase (quinone)